MTISAAPGAGVNGGGSDRHPYDYYYRDGMDLRPAPPRAGDRAGADWWEMRRRLFSRWMEVKPVPDETPLLQRLADHMWQGDELMDAVVALGRRIGPANLRDQFEQALAGGTDATPDAPPELRAVLEDMARVPDWFDAAAYERGRLLLVDCSPIGKAGGLIVNVIMTSFGEAVGSATGATGRLQRDPYRRQLETNAFFQTIPYADALEPYSATFNATARVRLMHCQVRAALRAKWGDEHFARHGNPISATDMALGVAAYAAVNLLIDQSFGRTVTERDLDDVTMFWAYHAFRFGVSEDALALTGREAVEMYDWCLANYGTAGSWAEEVAPALLNFTEELFTSSESKVANRIGARVAFPLFLGLVAHLGGDPVGYATAGATGRTRRQLQRYERAVKVLARGVVGYAALRDRFPGRQERMVRNAVDGDPFANASQELILSLAARHGHEAATYRSHDASTAADIRSR